MFILDCILMGRIQLKSHLGFPKRNKNKSAQSKMLNRSKKKSKRSSFFTTNPTDEINFKKKKKKKMKIFKKRNIINILSIQSNKSIFLILIANSIKSFLVSL